jgi:hypothetical protein
VVAELVFTFRAFKMAFFVVAFAALVGKLKTAFMFEMVLTFGAVVFVTDATRHKDVTSSISLLEQIIGEVYQARPTI